MDISDDFARASEAVLDDNSTHNDSIGSMDSSVGSNSILADLLPNQDVFVANPAYCCAMSASGHALTQAFTFWVEGVLIVLVGVFGLFGNVLSISVLLGPEMKNAFNHLLIVLAAVDSLLIGFAMFDYSFVRAFAVQFDLYTLMFPYFLYPTTNIVLCASIFLVLAIAFERFLAVCHPYEYRAIASTESVGGRVAKLTLPVFALAVVINIPKFFETKLIEVSLFFPVSHSFEDRPSR